MAEATIEYALRTCGINLAVDTSGYGEEGWVSGASEFSDYDYTDLANRIWWSLLLEEEVNTPYDYDLYRMVAPYMVAGFLVDPVTRVVQQAAPILGWAEGKDLFEVEDWAADQGHTIERV